MPPLVLSFNISEGDVPFNVSLGSREAGSGSAFNSRLFLSPAPTNANRPTANRPSKKQ
jgi:hypothetical protein